MPKFRLNPDKHRDTRPRTEHNWKRKPDKDTYGKCPLCNDKAELDFHHWTYGEAVLGVKLCRDCHKHLHRPDGALPGNSVGNEWIDLALVQLVARHQKNIGFGTAETVRDRYHVPYQFEVKIEELLNKMPPTKFNDDRDHPNPRITRDDE